MRVGGSGVRCHSAISPTAPMATGCAGGSIDCPIGTQCPFLHAKQTKCVLLVSAMRCAPCRALRALRCTQGAGGNRKFRGLNAWGALLHSGEAVLFSEQQLMDCSWDYDINKACDGGVSRSSVLCSPSKLRLSCRVWSNCNAHYHLVVVVLELSTSQCKENLLQGLILRLRGLVVEVLDASCPTANSEKHDQRLGARFASRLVCPASDRLCIRCSMPRHGGAGFGAVFSTPAGPAATYASSGPCTLWPCKYSRVYHCGGFGSWGPERCRRALVSLHPD
jgi:hypothetical protein